MQTVEQTILRHLIHNEEFSRKAAPFLRSEYFSDRCDKVVFEMASKFISDYNCLPATEALHITLGERKDLTQAEFDGCTEMLNNMKEKPEDVKQDWLIDTTEKFCQQRAVYNAIMESIQIIDGKSKTHTENAIPHILSDALAVSFDAHIGHDYIEDADSRFQFYHKVESRVPFDLEFMNLITNGGTPNKTLNIVMAGTGVGKSLFLCHHAANCLTQNKNVLYITCEMAEERIAERIDANLMDITMDEVKELPKQIFDAKLNRAVGEYTGKLIVKEYPTSTASSHNFRVLLEELKMKKKFVPDIIFIDYLNICASARLKQNGNVNSYNYVKAIAEELRGLAVEYDVPIFSATQVNRTGFASSDFGLEDTSESFGLPATADFMIAMIATEDLDAQGQVLIKQLKNRYNDTVANRKFILGINRAKMKLSDVEDAEQTGLVESNVDKPDDVYGSGFGGSKREQTDFSEWTV
jgi:replicative DNA helicase